MKIEGQNHAFAGGNAALQKAQMENAAGKTAEAKSGVKNVFAGNLNENLNPIEKKRKEAQEKAMKIVGDAFAGDKKIDDDLASRREHIRQLQEQMGAAQKEITRLEDKQTQLMEEYGIDPESQEQKDVELLKKRNAVARQDAGMIKSSGLSLTEGEASRLDQIDEKHLTEYQKRVLDFDGQANTFRKEKDAAEKLMFEENAIIRGVKNERLKSNPMLDAQEQAEQILDSASDEIKGMLVEQAKDKIDEDQEKKEEEAKEKSEEEKAEQAKLDAAQERREQLEALANPEVEQTKTHKDTRGDVPMDDMLELSQVKSEVQTEVENIVNKMNLVIEDIKGAVVDQEI